MAKSFSKYICQQCGYETTQWYGRCPNCQAWGSLVETIVAAAKIGGKQARGEKQTFQARTVNLADVHEEKFTRIPSGIEELDHVLGGGFVPGQVVLLAGEPGIGKSTLLSQVSEKIYPPRPANPHLREKAIIYVAGEESAGQIRLRTTRLGFSGKGVTVVEETDVDEIIDKLSVDSKKNTNNRLPNTDLPSTDLPSTKSLIIVDSIQTLSTADLIGMAGSVGQVRESAARLIAIAKRQNVPLILVGHVTKEGTIAGPRVLEHMVDTVLWFEGDRSQSLRILRAIKNRFGPTDEAGVFTMEDKGLVALRDPASYFSSEIKGVPGQACTVVLEGTRPLLVEIQALIVPSKLVMPRRVVQGVDSRRVELILAVLSRRVGVPLYNCDVFVNVAGGIQIREPASDLAIALAITSAWANKPMPVNTAAIGEVGLLGDIRQAPQFMRRAKEARRLGVKNLLSHETAPTLLQVVRQLRLKSSK